MLVFLISIFAFITCDAQAKDCNIPIHHYQELGCTANYTETNGNGSCPIFYNCPNLEKRDPKKCYYRGKTYEIEEDIKEASIYGDCVAACYCSSDDIANINCAVFDCLPPPGDYIPECFLAAEHNTCCHNELKCPPFDNLANCTINETVYYEGQRFPSPNLKTNCICMPDFDDEYIEPFCLPINCQIELYNAKELANKCAPVFADDVCPISWKCADDSDTFKPTENENNTDENCVYGKKELNIGDRVFMISEDVNYSDITCECLIPPLLTCRQTFIGQ